VADADERNEEKIAGLFDGLQHAQQGKEEPASRVRLGSTTSIVYE
jgi:hypothetical protein